MNAEEQDLPQDTTPDVLHDDTKRERLSSHCYWGWKPAILRTDKMSTDELLARLVLRRWVIVLSI